jgi:hypothetical protein
MECIVIIGAGPPSLGAATPEARLEEVIQGMLNSRRIEPRGYRVNLADSPRTYLSVPIPRSR